MPGVTARSASAPKNDWPGLAATLATFDDDRLAALLALRPDLAYPPPRDLPALAARAGAWPSARDCYLEVDRAARRVVDALCLLPRPTAIGDLAALLGVPTGDTDLTAALRRLEDRALAFAVPPATIRLLPALTQLDYPARLGPSLASALATHTSAALEQMAARLGAKPARTKVATLGLIQKILTDPVTVGHLVAQGPPGTEELARRVAAEGPLVNVRGGLYSIDERTPAGWLSKRGLLGIADFYTAVMPREPAVALRGGSIFPAHCLRRPEPVVDAVDQGTVDATAAERALRVVSDIAAIFEQWDVEPAAALKAGGLGIREVRRAAKVVDCTDEEAARILELAAVAGLARVDIVGGVARPTARYDEWLALEAPRRWAQLAGAWVASDLHLSLAGAIGTKEKPIPPLLDRGPELDAARRRRLVLDALERTPTGAAVTSASVHQGVEWDGPGVWGGGPATAAMLISWALDETQLIGLSAGGALSTAGRALVGGRLDDAAAHLVALAPPVVNEFVIQADFTAVVAGEAAVEVRAGLGLLADVESKGAATVYRFSEDSLRRAFDAGRGAQDILAFLEHHASRGVPQALAYLIGDLGRRFGNVRVGPAASYLRSDDPSLLAEVLQAKRTARLRLRRLAPTVLVSDVDAATVNLTLQTAGYLPARENADGTLLLTRPVAQRLPDKPVPAYAARRAPDPRAIVVELRRKPPPPAAASPKGPAAPGSPAPTPWAQPVLADILRPTDIIRDPRAVRALLGQACDEYWLARLSYVGSTGHATEITVEPTELDGRHLYAHCFPMGNERTFVIDRIEWARILTDAEENLLP